MTVDAVATTVDVVATTVDVVATADKAEAMLIQAAMAHSQVVAATAAASAADVVAMAAAQRSILAPWHRTTDVTPAMSTLAKAALAPLLRHQARVSTHVRPRVACAATAEQASEAHVMVVAPTAPAQVRRLAPQAQALR